MNKYPSLNEATKSDDWKCTGGVNAGQDSYRVFESEKTGQHLVIDGKDEKHTLEILKGEAA
jgi:hypothetical protein